MNRTGISPLNYCRPYLYQDWQRTSKRTFQARSHTYRCRGKVNWVCVCSLFIQHSKRTRHVRLLSVACLPASNVFFHITSWQALIYGKMLLNTKYFDVPYNFFLKRTSHSKKNSLWSWCFVDRASRYINESTPTWCTFLSLFIWSQCLYMFRALLAHLQGALHRCYLV
jgi:hypothetical protein